MITTQKLFIDWHRTSKQTSLTLPVRSYTIFRKPWGRNWQNKSETVFSVQRIYPVAHLLELPTCPSLTFCVIMFMQDMRVEALLNIRCIVKGYHLCRFEVNFCEVFTENKKKGERGKVFKVVNHREQNLATCLWILFGHYM